ncbi:hypothetical protein BDL97_14G024900 [Sphagnum fallax]|nr:hypothetical protein BDL97_14G024900 [Sphagnum fallax]
MRLCAGGWLLVCTLVLLPIFILGRVLAQEETEHIVFRENPPLVNMDQDVVQSSASKENQLSADKTRVSPTMINPAYEQHTASLHHDIAPSRCLHDVQEQRILLSSFADYVDPGSNTNPGIVETPVSAPPLP